MRRLPRATWIAIVVTGILVTLGSVMVNIGAPALTWLSPKVALVLFVLISLSLIGFSLWQERQKAASEPSAAAARENRQIMLGRVQNKWITGFLENPLYYSYDEQLLPLALRERVGSRFASVLSDPLAPTHPILPGTTITQVFEQARGELLILGEPGAGKTTLLLELARDLLKRAKDNEAAPMPVVLMLSSWATRKLPLEQWIVEELRMKYDVPSHIGKAWVEANQLLLLLDGLDEVAPSALPACIDAINEYYHQAHRSLVVCSRTKEFLDQPGRLALHTAVIVQPLSSEQVDTYLDGLAAKGEDVEGLKHALHQSEALRALATTSLFLTVLILAYHGKPVKELLALVKATPTDQPHLLLHNYVERSLQRKGTRIHAPAQQTKHWLAWLARQMTAHQQSELYLEQFQTDWLPKRQRTFYQWSIGLVVGLVVGLLFGLGSSLFSGLVVGLVVGLLFGLVVGLLFGLVTELSPAEETTWSWKGLGSGLFSGLVVGLLFGLKSVLGFGLGFMLVVMLVAGLVVFGLVTGLSPAEETTWMSNSYDDPHWTWKALGPPLFFGLVMGLVYGLKSVLGFVLVVGLVGLIYGQVFRLLGGYPMKPLPKNSKQSPNEGIQRSLINGLVVGLLFGLVVGLGFGLVVGLVYGLVVGLLFGLVVGLLMGMFNGLLGGLYTSIQHYTLRFWLWQARCTPSPRRYVAFLDDAVEQRLLRKVGGGYIFRHHLLQDYFASLDVAPPDDPSFRAEARSVLQNAPDGDPSL